MNFFGMNSYNASLAETCCDSLIDAVRMHFRSDGFESAQDFSV